MALVADPQREDGRLLTDRAGALVGRFVIEERDGGRFADLFESEPGVAPGALVAAIHEQLRGWQLSVEPALGRALIAAGGQARRHSYVMSRDLFLQPAPLEWLDRELPAGLRLTPVERPAFDLAPAHRAAYPPGHVDHGDQPDPERPELELEEIISGRLIGPLLPASGLAVTADGAVTGAVLVNLSRGEPPFGGPWITDVFRQPGARGIGTLLLRRALAIATRDGYPALSLAVTHGNRARERYAALGFVERLEAVNVLL